jgi:thioredoxin reductase
MKQDSPQICVIGAGPSGITAAKNLRQAGLDNIVVLEKSGRLGGNWVYDPTPGHSSVFETTHVISSKRLSEFLDYPMPKSYPDYPSHRQILQYFEDYAAHFKVTPAIRFHTEVTKARRRARGGWSLALADGAEIQCDYLLVANGHHWDPRWPDYPGTFAGEWMHAHSFKNNHGFEGKRVLVIGGGNSSCDIAVETGRVSKRTVISLRRGYYFVPKIMFGRASDSINARLLWLPDRLRIFLMELSLRLLVGSPRKYGLQDPDHHLFESHPVVNSELLYAIRHGSVSPKGDVARFEGTTVHFTDGSKEEFDAVVAATGYRISFPFLDASVAGWSGGSVPLYLKTIHPEYDDLFFIGLVQPAGCIWPLSDLQSRLAAAAITGRWQRPADLKQRIEREIAVSESAFLHTARHNIEVDYHRYRAVLVAELT